MKDSTGEDIRFVLGASDEKSVLGEQYLLIKNIATTIRIVMGWLSLTLEVFLRKDFGERYITWLRLYAGYSVAGILGAFLPAIIGELTGLYFLVFAGYVLMSLWHRFVIFLRNRKGESWHSYSPGIPRKLFTILPISEHVIFAYIEPIACFFAGGIAYRIDKVTGVWLSLSAICLLVKRQMEIMETREQYLDKIDAGIDAKWWGKVLNSADQKHKSGDMEGYVVPPMNLVNQIRKQQKPIEQTIQERMGSSAVQESEETQSS